MGCRPIIQNPSRTVHTRGKKGEDQKQNPAELSSPRPPPGLFLLRPPMAPPLSLLPSLALHLLAPCSPQALPRPGRRGSLPTQPPPLPLSVSPISPCRPPAPAPISSRSGRLLDSSGAQRCCYAVAAKLGSARSLHGAVAAPGPLRCHPLGATRPDRRRRRPRFPARLARPGSSPVHLLPRALEAQPGSSSLAGDAPSASPLPARPGPAAWPPAAVVLLLGLWRRPRAAARPACANSFAGLTGGSDCTEIVLRLQLSSSQFHLLENSTK